MVDSLNFHKLKQILILQNRAGVVDNIVLTVGLSFLFFCPFGGFARQIDKFIQPEFLHIRFEDFMLDYTFQIINIALFNVNRPTFRSFNRRRKNKRRVIASRADAGEAIREQLNKTLNAGAENILRGKVIFPIE